MRTQEEMEAIQAEVDSKIEDPTLKIAVFGASTAEAIYKLLIDKGIITSDEVRQGFFDSLEDKIKNL